MMKYKSLAAKKKIQSIFCNICAICWVWTGVANKLREKLRVICQGSNKTMKLIIFPLTLCTLTRVHKTKVTLRNPQTC